MTIPDLIRDLGYALAVVFALVGALDLIGMLDRITTRGRTLPMRDRSSDSRLSSRQEPMP